MRHGFFQPTQQDLLDLLIAVAVQTPVVRHGYPAGLLGDRHDHRVGLFAQPHRRAVTHAGGRQLGWFETGKKTACGGDAPILQMTPPSCNGNGGVKSRSAVRLISASSFTPSPIAARRNTPLDRDQAPMRARDRW